MALHQGIQRLLLIGARLPTVPPPLAPQPPAVLRPLIEAIAPAHRKFDQRAIHFGHRYRSGFWAIYLLSAIAVLFAVMPLALGWDDSRHLLHPFVGLWAIGEVVIIGAVGAIYWLGHRRDWQGQWLRARTTAELMWYLPLVAPLVDFTRAGADNDWFVRVFDPGQHLRGAADVEALCLRSEPLASEIVARAWADPAFTASYARWTIEILQGQRHYHQSVAVRQRALQHRVHHINTWLFGLTAVGAMMHLILHTLWLSIVTTFFPALGASLHGALAQSEAYRLSVTSERISADLQAAIARLAAMLELAAAAPAAADVRQAIEDAIALILQEHQDWHMLVRPHALPLA
jgi:hypothetical protein